jgi:hypothetical protein
MKTICTFLLVSFLFITLTYAAKVDENKAKIAGKQFITNNAVAGKIRNIADLSLIYTSRENNLMMAPGQEGIVNYYVFNINSNQGFIIVSGDDIVEPILGYSTQGSFNPDKIPPHVALWLKGYEDQIQFAINHQMQATPAIKAKWALFTNTNHPQPFFKAPQGVSPLVQTQWNQSPYYNALCPYDNNYSDYTVTGCVATAMAQVLKYWNSPTTGSGFHSYNDPNYGTQSADFGSTTYDWTNMPLSITGPNTPIATLMYHCGVSVDMTYGVAQTGGSSAYVISSASPDTNCAEYALKTYFGYPTTLHGLARSSYDDATWKSMLKADLDASRPVIYDGFGSGGGHCFVCDGYDDNGLFHFNWGWQGQYDGYFDLDALNPEGVGTGGGTGGFNSGQQAIFGIQGPNGGGGGGGGGQSSGLQVYASVDISSSPLYYGNSFFIHTDILNADTATFNGDYCAAIFDSSGTFIDYVQILTGYSLPPNYHYTNGLKFSNSGLFDVLPGNYQIYVFSRMTGGNWQIVADGNGFTNGVQVAVINPNAIEMYAQMTVTPGTTLTVNQPVSVHLDVVNNGTSTFTGTWDVSLYNLDGSFAVTIQTLTGNNLPSGYHYTNGLTFSTQNLNTTPGSYLMALQYLPDGGNWTLTGSTYYENPIEVLVQQETLSPDMYEPNDNVGAAYNLPVTFSGNTATVGTPNANCNTGNDYDFYKIDLPNGNSYSIGAAVYDLAHPGGMGTFTLDAIWSYSTDGTTWSSVFDSIDPNPITMASGGTVYFEVAPKFNGSTGTYLLSMTVNQNPFGIGTNSTSGLNIYPNPASDLIYIEPASGYPWPSNVTLYNTQGQEVLNVIPQDSHERVKMDVKDFPDGLYFLKVYTNEGVLTRQVVIRK